MATTPPLLTQLRQRTMQMNRAFSRMPVLIHDTRRLAINAEIASLHMGPEGKPFGTVVRDLSRMANSLSEVVEHMEEVFSRIVATVARWIQAENRLSLYRRAVHGAVNGGVKTPEGMRPVAAQCDGQDAAIGDFVRDTLDQILKLRAKIQMVLNVAMRQSQFIAVTAKIEAARTGGKLSAVANDIRALSGNVATVAETANLQIMDLLFLARKVLNDQSKGATDATHRVV